MKNTIFMIYLSIKSTDKTLVVESYRAYRDRDGNLVRKDKLYTDTYKKH